jgi:hypothetical protein
MNVINQFLSSPFSRDNSNDIKTSNNDRISYLNKMFADKDFTIPKMRILPRIKQNQIWSVKTEYLDYEGILQTALHPMYVIINTDPELLDAVNEFVRVCPISPFVEMSSDLDQICDDPSVIGFPFLVETWNEQPIMLDILDKYLGDYYSDMNERDEDLNAEQQLFREIEISNARYLNQSIIAYTNERERSQAFSYSVDVASSKYSKTKHMPLLNIDNPLIIPLRDNEEYASAARMGIKLSENDCIEFKDDALPFRLEVRKKEGLFILTIKPNMEIQLLNSAQQVLQASSNAERVVYGELKAGLYEIKSSVLEKSIKLRLK